MNPTELLAPARDLECGVAAIQCGADAVYIGAPRFGARQAAGNSLDDIAALARYAHQFWARVYATLNTLLTGDELPAARRLAWQLYEAGVDGLIIQDPGLLEGDLPPLPLIASTQMHNHTPARVAFLEQVGFHRAILARELTLEEIRAIRAAAPRIELESFVHGALCVCFSGQCYLSYAIGGRSANRGQCAQPCRKAYTLVDARGRVLERGKHLLSLRDLNLSAEIPALIAAGVTAFKIEGRLKDRTYVANLVACYRRQLDALGVRRSSSGTSTPGFTPDPAKTFNRGFTTYFLKGRGAPMGSIDTPKMTGEALGRVVSVQGRGFTIDSSAAIHPGDGLCFFDSAGHLRGVSVNAVRGPDVIPDKMEGIAPGAQIFRNHDHSFLTGLARSRSERRIAITFKVRGAAGGLLLSVEDEDGNRAEGTLAPPLAPADEPQRALQTLRRQLAKTGQTEFSCAGVEIELDTVPFVPVSRLNALRREALTRLSEVRSANRPRERRRVVPNEIPFPERELTYLGNVLNPAAEAFYRRHGVVHIEPAAESGLDLNGRKVMTTRYCIREELGMCARQGHGAPAAEPLALIDAEGRRLELRFDCRQCRMEVYFHTGSARPHIGGLLE